MKPTTTLEFIAEAAERMRELRLVLQQITHADSLETAQKLAKEVLQKTITE